MSLTDQLTQAFLDERRHPMRYLPMPLFCGRQPRHADTEARTRATYLGEGYWLLSRTADRLTARCAVMVWVDGHYEPDSWVDVLVPITSPEDDITIRWQGRDWRLARNDER